MSILDNEGHDPNGLGNGPSWSEIRRLDAEIGRLREALTRADYYINRLEAAHRGHVVRDLDEACNAWESYVRRVDEQITPSASPDPTPS